MKLKFHIMLVGLLVVAINANAQTCGFGCLGMSGFYVGYSYQFSEFSNLNNELKSENLKFDNLNGFRIGANIFRAKFDNYFLSIKGYYQVASQTVSNSSNSGGAFLENEYELNLNHWGVGIDFGIPITDYFEYKIVEGGINIYSAEFSYKNIMNGNELVKIKYKSNKTDIGYFIGTGFIFHLVKNYASIEGLIYYNKIAISSMTNSNNQYLFQKEDSLIDNGGFAGTIQLNIGVPF